MEGYKQITVKGFFVEAALFPCPWCKKTPDLKMPLDQKGAQQDETWKWEISCSCHNSSVYVPIRRTSKTHLGRFLQKVDDLFDKWNKDNPIKPYEKKVLDLRMIPNLGVS